MEYIVIALISMIIGFCIGNTTIRSKIIEELKSLRTEKTQPIRARVTYVPKPRTRTETTDNVKTSSGGCNKCGSGIEPIGDMPGYYYCAKCDSVTSKGKAIVS